MDPEDSNSTYEFPHSPESPLLWARNKPVKPTGVVRSVDRAVEGKQKQWTHSTILDLVFNGVGGMADPERSCPLCCLKAFRSNLRSLYKNYAPAKIPIGRGMKDAVKALKGYYHELPVLKPFYKGKILTSHSHKLYEDIEWSKEIESNIEKTLLLRTFEGEIRVYAVGIAAEYHSTLIVISKDTDFNKKFTEGYIINRKSNGMEKNALMLFVEDVGGARSFSKKNLDSKVNEFFGGAFLWYNGLRDFGAGKYPHPETDTSLATTLYELYAP